MKVPYLAVFAGGGEGGSQIPFFDRNVSVPPLSTTELEIPTLFDRSNRVPRL